MRLRRPPRKRPLAEERHLGRSGYRDGRHPCLPGTPDQRSRVSGVRVAAEGMLRIGDTVDVVTVTVGAVAQDLGADFRRRLLDAMAESVRVKGLTETTIADIVRLAKTSRRTFYEHFPSREDCYIALLTESSNALIERITAAVQPDLDWEAQVEAAVRAWIDTAAEDPGLTRSWIREIPLLGAQGRAIQREGVETLVATIQALAARGAIADAGIPIPDSGVATILIGGLHELMAMTVEDGRDIRTITDTAILVTKSLVFVTPKG